MNTTPCDEETRVLVSALSDGQTTSTEERRARLHLDGCPECRARFEEWAKLGELFQWAYTSDLPEVQIMTPEIETTTKRTPRVRAGRLRGTLILRRTAAFGAVGLAVAAALLAWNAREPVLKGTLKTGNRGRVVLMETGARLEVSPNSSVTRMGDAWVRLETGSVRIAVEHGERPFRLQSPRLETSDLGTRFTVATGEKGDVVSVDEGAVSVRLASQDPNSQVKARAETVRAGQVFQAFDGQEATLLPPIPTVDGEDKQWALLHDPKVIVGPTTPDFADWWNDARRLSERQPGLRAVTYRNGRTAREGDLEYRAYSTPAPGLRAGLRAHLRDIATGLSGAPIPGEAWECIVGYLQVSGISEPRAMPADLYMVSLRNERSRLVWRLTGSRGKVGDFPVTAAEFENASGSTGRTGAGPASGAFLMDRRRARRGPGEQTDIAEVDCRLSLPDWPGRLIPTMRFTLQGMSPQESDPEGERMCSTAAAMLPQGPGSRLPSLTYLDAEKRGRVVTSWDHDAVRRMIDHLRSRGSRGHIELIGVIVTDAAWESPAVPPGSYPVWWVQPAGGASRLEIPAPNVSGRIPLPTLKVGDPDSGRAPSFSPRDISMHHVDFRYMGATEGAYRFRIQVLKDDLGGRSSLVQGWFSVKKP